MGYRDPSASRSSPRGVIDPMERSSAESQENEKQAKQVNDFVRAVSDRKYAP
jgi:hypothetical protein